MRAMLALAARQLGIAAIPVMVAAGWSEAQKRAYVLADNQLAIRTAVVRDPYARWCGRGGTARCPPIPIVAPLPSFTAANPIGSPGW